MKLGDTLPGETIAALEALKPDLPPRRLREEADPMAVATESLLALLGACLSRERHLPRLVRDQLKRTIAACGSAGITNQFRKPSTRF
jgi:hypothetical protein